MKQERIILIGGGGHCHSVIDVIEQQGIYQIYGLVDVKEKIGSKVLGYPVLGCDDDLVKIRMQCNNAVITIGHIASNSLRIKLFNLAKKLKFNLPVIISPLAYVSPHATIQEGTVVLHQALINSNAEIGVNCIINSKVLVEHDSVIGDQCHIATAAVLNGNVHVESNSFVGSNSVAVQNAQINGFVKAGSVYK